MNPNQPDNKMRTCKLFKWERRIEKREGDYSERTYMEKVPDGEGVFHQWGVNYEELETNAGNFTTAIVERPDGTVVNIAADMIQFTD